LEAAVLLENVKKLTDSYRKSRFSHILKSEKDYIVSPKPDGYRGIHLIYQYKALERQNKAYDKLRIEIQIRTNLQHIWATAVEAVGIFTREALKSNVGNKDWLRLFALEHDALKLKRIRSCGDSSDIRLG
jgi:ppGpp synthetase/RelA/SpoT-type nucleotidyltranferase